MILGAFIGYGLTQYIFWYTSSQCPKILLGQYEKGKCLFLTIIYTILQGILFVSYAIVSISYQDIFKNKYAIVACIILSLIPDLNYLLYKSEMLLNKIAKHIFYHN